MFPWKLHLIPPPSLLRFVSLLLAVALFALPGFCGEHRKQEGFGFIGIGKNYDDEGSIGKGLSTGGGWGYRLSSRFGMEGELNWFRNKREFGSMYPPFQGDGMFLMGSGLWYFTQGRVEGYLIGGAGLAHYRTKVDFSGNEVHRSGNGFAANFGSGVKVHITERIYLRPELRILMGNAGSAIEAPLRHLRLSVGMGYRW
jgi:hypothetical protein